LVRFQAIDVVVALDGDGVAIVSLGPASHEVRVLVAPALELLDRHEQELAARTSLMTGCTRRSNVSTLTPSDAAASLRLSSSRGTGWSGRCV
jgi:hypothetical protein